MVRHFSANNLLNARDNRTTLHFRRAPQRNDSLDLRCARNRPDRLCATSFFLLNRKANRFQLTQIPNAIIGRTCAGVVAGDFEPAGVDAGIYSISSARSLVPVLPPLRDEVAPTLGASGSEMEAPSIRNLIQKRNHLHSELLHPHLSELLSRDHRRQY